ncbi:PD-(D/E)XK nuclease family protein [Paenibacillus sp. PAMC21692]|uniref:PD-(D/E)XK nuclease family protein n=1 Tax=Paenibacillus sp. PAMC21692 TaxID=2762320 RepID=UPI00164DE738|nr:PD-(D/E)XK nuclease family protein [Paenibacillus sp. PAMC21692]QNK56451.1 PD-(D/E)XK nuclease family protein [Paenibacillus sp. PAMC21692]
MPKDLMDRLLAAVTGEPLRRKVLLAHSYAQGQQLLERLCARAGAIANVEIETVRGLAAKRAKLELFLNGITLLEEGQVFWIVRMLMEELATDAPTGYIHEGNLKPGIVDGVNRSLGELRLARLAAADIRAEAFTHSGKAEYMRQLLSRYELYLTEQRTTDFAGLVHFVTPDNEDTLYLAIEPTGWMRAEREMTVRIAGERLEILEAEATFGQNAGFAGNSFALFSASGPIAEVREGLRRMLGQADSIDGIEIMAADYERYAPIVYDHAKALGLACTLSSGLPIGYCPAGQAALGLLDWIQEGYPVSKLTELLRYGRLRIEDERFTQNSWIRLLEQSGIGWGKDRYISLLEPSGLAEGDREQGAALHAHALQWFGSLPDNDQWHPFELLNWLARNVAIYAAGRSPEDAGVHSSLRELAFTHAKSPSGSMTRELAIRYVRGMLDGIRIRVSPTPKPGAIHVSSLSGGGWSGRGLFWIPGMDESSWSVSARQDPVLLDEERIRLSPDLTTRRERASAQRLERESRIGFLRGELWLSYSSYDPGEQKSHGAAFEMLQLFRLQRGDAIKDFGALSNALGEPYGVLDMRWAAGGHIGQANRPQNAAHHAPPNAESARLPLNGIDAWAKLLANARGERLDGREAIRGSYPALAEGYRAVALRQADGLSAYDGWIGEHNRVMEQGGRQGESLPGIVPKRDYISVSELEQYASCGLRYYFGYVLNLPPKETAELDRTRWLQANEKGSLLHETYRRYMEEATGSGARAAVHDRERLYRQLEQVLSAFATRIPAPSSHVFNKEAEELRRDADVFYQVESVNADQPLFFELELKTEDGEPMEVELANGMRFRLKGFIDRIDRIGPHEYRIIDYKTGSPAKFKPSEYFSGGTQLQHAIYSVAAEQWLRTSGYDAEAAVTEADYRFPTAKGRGEFVRREQNRRSELAVVIKGLLDSRESGLFIPASDIQQCRWCDYASVCGAHATRMVEKRQLEGNGGLLGTLLEVESYG